MPSGIIEMMLDGEKVYFWYYEDLKYNSDNVKDDMEITF